LAGSSSFEFWFVAFELYQSLVVNTVALGWNSFLSLENQEIKEKARFGDRGGCR
jgi:hypothetical protein